MAIEDCRLLQITSEEVEGHVIGPHRKGAAGVASFMAGYYVAIAFLAGAAVGAVAASIVWIVVS